MGRRSDFKRRPHDAYQTIDPKATLRLMPHLNGIKTFAEPCVGEGKLLGQLYTHGLTCTFTADIRMGVDALTVTDFGNPDAIITNPPWTRQLLHPMILHFQKYAPTWLLFDSDWAYNAQAEPFLDQCSDIVAVGRLRWMEDKNQSGKDNASWYRFDVHHTGGPHFHGRPRMNAPNQNFIGPTPADLVTEYLDLRDRKKDAEEKIKEFIRLNFQDRIEAIELELLDSLNRLGADNIKTPYGTAFKRVETSVTVQDAAEFKRHVIGTEAWELLDIRANKVAVREFVENNSGQLPPGINMTQDTVISVRKKTPKE